jgi:hypothetical protein
MSSAAASVGRDRAVGFDAYGGMLRYLRDALASTTWREAGYALFVGLLIGVVDSAWLFETAMSKNKLSASIFVPVVTAPLILSPFVLCAWVLADRANGSRLGRATRLTLAVLLANALAALLIPHALAWLGVDADLAALYDDDKLALAPAWMEFAVRWLSLSVYSGLAVATFEMYGRRQSTQDALARLRAEQSALARQLLESRLAAMQAQIEPQFLFDSLVDVQATYHRDAARGADVLDRLITYLRVALPRLREAGSTVQAEVELVAAYLAVVSARHGGKPVAHFAVAAECAAARFYPMLLLPLVQRAMRSGAQADRPVPERIDLAVKQHGEEIVAVLRIAAARLCADDAELARVRQRLEGLYDGRARLACDEPAPATTQFTLCLPQQ